jgi:hypothetical protein
MPKYKPNEHSSEGDWINSKSSSIQKIFDTFEPFEFQVGDEVIDGLHEIKIQRKVKVEIQGCIPIEVSGKYDSTGIWTSTGISISYSKFHLFGIVEDNVLFPSFHIFETKHILDLIDYEMSLPNEQRIIKMVESDMGDGIGCVNTLFLIPLLSLDDIWFNSITDETMEKLLQRRNEYKQQKEFERTPKGIYQRLKNQKK